MGKRAGAIEQIAETLTARKNREKAERASRRPVVQDVAVPIDEFTAKHGDYARDGTKLRNRTVDAVEGWRARNLLSDQQYRAIELCQRLWLEAHTEPNQVMDYLKIPGMPGGTGLLQQYALDDLAWLKHRIPLAYWDVFENICRWNMLAHIAGVKLADGNRRRNDRALLVVQFVADLVAAWKRL